MKSNRQMKRAFTLLEIMLVIVIILMLGAVVVRNISGQGDKARRQTTMILVKSVGQDLEMFKMDMGRFPTTEEGLKALYSKDSIQDEELAKKWDGPYHGEDKGETVETEFKIKDAWEHELHYASPGEHNTKTFDLYSDGPDGQEGNDDDIVNWTVETR